MAQHAGADVEVSARGPVPANETEDEKLERELVEINLCKTVAQSLLRQEAKAPGSVPEELVAWLRTLEDEAQVEES